MTVHLWGVKVTYVAVPKVACTSIKHAFFQVENGRQFDDFIANGQYFHIHKIYPTKTFQELPKARITDHFRVGVIRDPVRRLLSCYRDKVIYNRRLSEAAAGPALREANLPTNPSLSQFIARLADYRRAVPIIDHHAAPQVRFLGRNPDYYAAIVPIGQLADLARTMADVLQARFVIDHHQNYGPKFDPSVLSTEQVAVIRRHYEEDYDRWGRYL